MSAVFLPYTQGGSLIPLALPVLAAAVVSDTDNDTDISTAAFSINAGDFVMAFTGSRDSNSTTHAVAMTGATCAALTTVQVAAEGPVGTNYARTQCHYGTVTAGSASAVVTLTGNQNLFQKVLLVLKWNSGGRTIDQKKGGGSVTGTGLTVTPDATPDAGAASLFFYVQETTNGTPALSGHTDDLSASGTISSMKWAYFSKLGSPPAAWSITGITDNGQSRAGIGVTIL